MSQGTMRQLENAFIQPTKSEKTVQPEITTEKKTGVDLRRYTYSPKPKPPKNPEETKSLFPSGWDDFFFGEQGAYQQWTYVSNAKYGHHTNPYVYACVNKIQQTVSGIHLFVVQHTKDEEGKPKEEPVEDPQNPVVKLLRKPNNRQRYADWVKERIGHKYYKGEWTTYKNAVSTGEVTELINLRPDRMKEVLNKEKTEIDYWEYRVEGVSDPIIYQPEEISHIKTWHPTDDWRGLAPVSVARAVIETLNAAKTWNKSMLENFARPGGFYSVPGALNDAQVQRLKQQLRERYAGPANAYNTIVLEGGADWKNQQMNASDLDFVEGQKMNAREISIILQVPSELLNDSTNKTYNNQKEAVNIYYHDCILPLLDEIVDELNEFVVYPYDSQMELKYDVNEIEALKEDMTLLVQRESMKIQSGIATPNEVRPEFGLSSDVPQGDTLYISGNLIPLGDVKKKVAVEPPQPQKEEGPKIKTIDVREYS